MSDPPKVKDKITQTPSIELRYRGVDPSILSGISIGRVSARQLVPENIFLFENPLEDTTPIRTVEIDPFDFCNHQCTWCFTKPFRIDSDANIDQLSIHLRTFAAAGGAAVHYSGGGEPLLYRPMISPYKELDGMTLCEFTCSLGLVTSLITNGVFLDRLPALSLLPNIGFIRVSLDATDASSHSLRHQCSRAQFGRITDSLMRLIDERGGGFVPAIGASFIVNPDHGQFTSEWELDALATLAQKLRLDYVQIKHVHTKMAAEADDLMSKVYRHLLDMRNGQTEFWVHRYRQASPARRCRIVRLSEVWDAEFRKYPCCHLYGRRDYMITRRDSDAAKREVIGCKSSVCRYESMNILLEKCAMSADSGDQRASLKKNLHAFGFHPYRLYPSAPELFPV